MASRLVLALLCLLAAAPAAAAERVAGPARVIDGDTLEVAGRSVRLEGIDAPEIDQTCRDASGARYPCGRLAAKTLAGLVSGKRVRCEGPGPDPRGRLVAVCHAGGRDLGGALTRAGWTLAFRKFSARYIPQEEAARARGVGLWAGSFTDPWAWRADRREAERAAGRARAERRRANGECVIKGNISGNGRIYHMPGQRWYARTRISPGKGERWFCSEAEARAAGWRRAFE
ncbi:MAG: thermonuclease family protein [Pseudomonadota bacterium]